MRDRVGVGGMSVVWRAHDEILGRDVAVKVLSAAAAADPVQLGRIRREARAVAGLRHPNIVEVYDYGEAPGDPGAPPQPYVVMELVEGESLTTVLARGPLPWRTAVLICSQVAAALAAAHTRGVVHRDVKPGNVMVTPDGVKLLDFGISALAGAADETDGEVLGTPAYLAPERLDGGPVRPASDVYGLGLLLHRALAGRMPWEASTLTQIVRAHLNADPEPLPPIAGLPREVAELGRRCLAKRPEDRPEAAEAARILGEALGLTPLGVLPSRTTADEDTVAVRPPLSRRRRSQLAAAAVAVPAVAAASLFWPSGEREPVRAVAQPPAAAAAGPEAPRCTVHYTVRSAAGGRLTSAVSVVNTGDSALADWRLTFALPSGQRLVRGWDDRWRDQGGTAQVSGTDLAAGAKVSTGFDAAYEGAATVPTRFEVNGAECEPVVAAPQATATSFPPPARTTGSTTAGSTTAGSTTAGSTTAGAAAGGPKPAHVHEEPAKKDKKPAKPKKPKPGKKKG